MYSTSKKINYEPFLFFYQKFFWKIEDFMQFRSLKIAKMNFENRKLEAEARVVCVNSFLLFQKNSQFL